ncbi:MAG: hypothetical protein JSR09_06160 [Bacteroidetes bacterium]|nr:hypothetical protein [Bacteroidota bacterium]MBS1649273.1 hypothetical protein [Bacteroidota bacterium]
MKSKTNKPVSVLYKAENNKRALVSLMLHDLQSNNHTHTIYAETKAFCFALFELGYNVDLINFFDNNATINFDQYNAVVGMRKHIDDAIVYKHQSATKKLKIITYVNGPHPYFQNEVAIHKLINFYNQKKILLPKSVSFIEENYALQYSFADAIILHGNEFVKSTFLPYTQCPIETVKAIAFQSPYTIDIAFKEENRKNFLWFGSTKCLHRGLDIVLDYFIKRKDLQLTICSAALQNEPEFYDLYKEQLANSSNISIKNFVAIGSEEFKQICEANTFLVYMSITEGNCASVITCMKNGGLIPLVTNNVGVDIDNCGFTIKAFTELALQETINNALIADSQNLNKMKIKSKAYGMYSTDEKDFRVSITAHLKKHLFANITH